MTRKLFLAAAAALLLLPASSLAARACENMTPGEAIGTHGHMPAAVTLGDLTLEGAFTRATPPNAMAGGGFVTITNNGSEDDRLIAASSPAAPRVELHTMAVIDGVMRMREMEGGIDIPAGETVNLAPGGLHVMFMQLPAPFVAGTMVEVTLTFEKAGSVTIMMPVVERGSEPAHTMQH